MSSSLRLGRILGIEIGIHYTWLIVFGLVVWSLAIGLPGLFPGWPVAAYWIVAVVSSLLLFVSVLAHEMAHSLVAISQGLPVGSIVLFIFGGVSNIKREARRPVDELVMAAAGPATSLVLAAFFGALLFALRHVNEQVVATLLYLSFTNVALAVFNLIPGFPLDGGRVLRATLWWLTGSILRATRIASIAGQVVAYGLILGGLLWAFNGNFLGGIWLAVIGWFLHNGAEMSYRQIQTQESFRRFHVGDLMNPHPYIVAPGVSLQSAVDNYILPHSVRALPVVQDAELVGMVTLSDIKEVPRERWNAVAVRDVMTARDKLQMVDPDTDLGEILGALSEDEVNQLPVVIGNHLVGLLSRSQLMRFLQVREELGLRQ